MLRIKEDGKIAKFLVRATDRNTSYIQNMRIADILIGCFFYIVSYTVYCVVGSVFVIIYLSVGFIIGFFFGYRPICFKEDQDERYVYENGTRYEKTFVKYKKWPTIKGCRILPIYIFIFMLAAMYYDITLFILGCCCGIVFIIFCMEKFIFPVVDWFIKLTKLTEEEEKIEKEKRENKKPFIIFFE
jgi:hypothetical protein